MNSYILDQNHSNFEPLYYRPEGLFHSIYCVTNKTIIIVTYVQFQSINPMLTLERCQPDLQHFLYDLLEANEKHQPYFMWT